MTVTATLPELFGATRQPWVVVNQKTCGGYATDHTNCSTYTTHYFCGECWGELTPLTVHHVRCCPYCTVALPHCPTFREQEAVDFHGDWPYEVIRRRFRSFCQWHGEDPSLPWTIHADGSQSRELGACRELEGHDGPHRYMGPRAR